MKQERLAISMLVKENFVCPCCGYLTLTELPPGTFEICPVCYWEDDAVQYHNIDFAGGANEESLRQARCNFKKFGSSSLKYLNEVRAPLSDEVSFIKPDL